MDRIPETLRQTLISNGYDQIDTLPNVPDLPRWAGVQTDCQLTGAQLNRIINALFPAPLPSGILLSQ